MRNFPSILAFGPASSASPACLSGPVLDAELPSASKPGSGILRHRPAIVSLEAKSSMAEALGPEEDGADVSGCRADVLHDAAEEEEVLVAKSTTPAGTSTAASRRPKCASCGGGGDGGEKRVGDCS
mmetsp:Transcript_100107/g.254580  ORF Transcript_100107/g.254580 Transcript_100107/m.254580 type:complete len:126 (-) Transcript_100107:288-665(-)